MGTVRTSLYYSHSVFSPSEIDLPRIFSSFFFFSLSLFLSLFSLSSPFFIRSTTARSERRGVPSLSLSPLFRFFIRRADRRIVARCLNSSAIPSFVLIYSHVKGHARWNLIRGGGEEPYRRVRIEICARNQAGFEKCNPTARLWASIQNLAEYISQMIVLTRCCARYNWKSER